MYSLTRPKPFDPLSISGFTWVHSCKMLRILCDLIEGLYQVKSSDWPCEYRPPESEISCRRCPRESRIRTLWKPPATDLEVTFVFCLWSYHPMIQKKVLAGPEERIDSLAGYRQSDNVSDLVESDLETWSNQDGPSRTVQVVSQEKVEVGWDREEAWKCLFRYFLGLRLGSGLGLERVVRFTIPSTKHVVIEKHDNSSTWLGPTGVLENIQTCEEVGDCECVEQVEMVFGEKLWRPSESAPDETVQEAVDGAHEESCYVHWGDSLKSDIERFRLLASRLLDFWNLTVHITYTLMSFTWISHRALVWAPSSDCT